MYIHGKAYDLAEFRASHPGGARWLDIVEGEDATALFESYHATSLRRSWIDNKLRSLEVEVVPPSKVQQSSRLYSFKEDDFYQTVAERVRAKFPSGTRGIKATRWTVAKNWCLVIFLIIAARLAWYGGCIGAGGGVVLGALHTMVGFCVMHDASHAAVSTSASLNQMLSRLTNASQLWWHDTWLRHHCVAHHSHTGHEKLDPDKRHALPLIAKHVAHLKKRALVLGTPTSRAIYHAAVMTVMPGQFVGQIIGYTIGLLRGHLWGVSLRQARRSPLEVVVFVTILAFHGALLFMHPFSDLAYFLGFNLLYFCSIAPNHDVAEVAVAAQMRGAVGTVDWGEAQVRASANFSTNVPLIGLLLGGINYQIEHHLFPGVSHAHYPELQQIVRDECEKRGLPYVDHSWAKALKSYFQALEWTNSQRLSPSGPTGAAAAA